MIFFRRVTLFLMIAFCCHHTFASCKKNNPLVNEDIRVPPPARDNEEEDGDETVWTQKEFVLSTFFALPGSGDPNLYRRILTDTKNAGINLVEIPFIAPSALMVALNVAEEVGVKVLAQNQEIYSGIGGESPVINKDLIEKEVNLLNRFKMLEGYYVWDEPFEANFESVKKINKILRDSDPKRLAFSTLFPSYGVYNWEEGEYNWENNTYAQYVSKYMEEVDPVILSFNYYPFRDNKEETNLIQNDLWRDFGYIRQKAIEYDKPLWYYFQAVSIDPNHPGVMNLERIRAQMYAALAYGVKGLSYYTTHRSLLTTTFEKSAMYNDLSILNNEVKNIGNFLLHTRSEKIYHTGLNSTLQAGYFCDSFLESTILNEAPDNLIIGILIKDDTRFVVVTNKDHGKSVSGKLKFNQDYTVSIFNPSTNSTSSSLFTSEMNISLEAGGIAVFVLK